MYDTANFGIHTLVIPSKYKASVADTNSVTETHVGVM